MSSFEDRLWSELVLEHGPELASITRTNLPHRTRMGPVTVGAVVAAGALAAVALTATTGPSPSDAYSVSQSSDGTVTVSIKELSGVSGANEQLSKLQVRVKVATVEPNCAEVGEIVPIPHPIVSDLAHVGKQGLAIEPNLIPEGDTLVISATETESVVSLNRGLYKSPGPSCIAPGDSHVG